MDRVIQKPVIGVTESRNGRPSMPFFNWLSLRLAGPLDGAAFDGLDGLLIGGGDDIGFELYGGVPVPNVKLDPERDKMELAALDHATRTDIPILGVCRGAQMLNVFYGGTLHEDIYEVYEAAPRNRTVLPRKSVSLEVESRLREIVGRNEIKVNSLHHQAVDRLGIGLKVSARDTHGMVQAIEDPNTPFRVGVQWHPEFLFYRTAHFRLFRDFVEAVKSSTIGTC